MNEYQGESKKCLIKYGDMELEIGYTAMHNLVSHIDNTMTYFMDLAEIQQFLDKVRNQMGHDAELEMNAIKEKEHEQKSTESRHRVD